MNNSVMHSLIFLPAACLPETGMEGLAVLVLSAQGDWLTAEIGAHRNPGIYFQQRKLQPGRDYQAWAILPALSEFPAVAVGKCAIGPAALGLTECRQSPSRSRTRCRSLSGQSARR